MDQELTRILEEVQIQREQNSWVEGYLQYHFWSSKDSARTQAEYVYHIQKNESEEQPLEHD